MQPRTSITKGVPSTPKAPAAESRGAVEVCRGAELSHAARTLLRPSLKVKPFVEILLEEDMVDDAMVVAAHALPKREAVHWATLCLREVADEPELERSGAALAAAEKWVRSPTEENRRAAGAAAEAQEYRSAAAMAAAGAFWSEGSMAPPAVSPPVPAPDFATAKAVAGAVSLAAVMREPAKATRRYLAFAELAWDLPAIPRGDGR